MRLGLRAFLCGALCPSGMLAEDLKSETLTNTIFLFATKRHIILVIYHQTFFPQIRADKKTLSHFLYLLAKIYSAWAAYSFEL